MSFRSRKYVSTTRAAKDNEQSVGPSLVDINTFDEYSIKDILVQSYQWINDQI